MKKVAVALVVLGVLVLLYGYYWVFYAMLEYLAFGDELLPTLGRIMSILPFLYGIAAVVAALVTALLLALSKQR